MMETLEFNLNYQIKVKLRDKGIEHCVINHNRIMPFQHHTSFREYKAKADSEGYHTYQMHDFMDVFGGLGLEIASFVDLNILIPKKFLSNKP